MNVDVEADRIRILNSIAKRELKAAPLESHIEYDHLNAILHWRAGIALYELAYRQGADFFNRLFCAPCIV